jgi:hypothetical protein
MGRDQLSIVLENLKLVQKFNTIRQKVAAHQGNHPEELLAFLTHTSIAFPHLRAHIGILPEEKNHFGLRLQKMITSASPSSRDTPGFTHPLSRFITNY